MATAKCVGLTITAVAVGTSFIIWRRARSRCSRRIRAFICGLPSTSFISSRISCLLMRRSCLCRRMLPEQIHRAEDQKDHAAFQNRSIRGLATNARAALARSCSGRARKAVQLSRAIA